MRSALKYAAVIAATALATVLITINVYHPAPKAMVKHAIEYVAAPHTNSKPASASVQSAVTPACDLLTYVQDVHGTRYKLTPTIGEANDVTNCDMENSTWNYGVIISTFPGATMQTYNIWYGTDSKLRSDNSMTFGPVFKTSMGPVAPNVHAIFGYDGTYLSPGNTTYQAMVFFVTSGKGKTYLVELTVSYANPPSTNIAQAVVDIAAKLANS